MENKRIYLNNARNCLRIFLRNTNIKELWCPYKTCSVVFKAVKTEGVHLKFYHIDENFYPLNKFPKDDFILYPNYFGVCDLQAEKLAQEYPNLIYDSAQSLFSKPLGIASVYSLRKFLPVADGGTLISNIQISLPPLREETEVETFSTNSSNFEYEKFLKNELKFNQTNEIKLISQKSLNILNKTDFEIEKQRRREKFKELHKKYAAYNELVFAEIPSSPMVYPLKTKVEELIHDAISGNKTFLQYDYMKDMLPIPLD